jgi:predicted RNase H-like HicB family nuclease
MMVASHYIALIHKEPESGYGVSFPDVPGVIAVADTLDEALTDASEALGFAFEDWRGELPAPRSLDLLRADPEFLSRSQDAVVAAVRVPAERQAA